MFAHFSSISRENTSYDILNIIFDATLVSSRSFCFLFVRQSDVSPRRR